LGTLLACNNDKEITVESYPLVTQENLGLVFYGVCPKNHPDKDRATKVERLTSILRRPNEVHPQDRFNHIQKLQVALSDIGLTKDLDDQLPSSISITTNKQI
jgi:hypothetical protein